MSLNFAYSGGRTVQRTLNFTLDSNGHGEFLTFDNSTSLPQGSGVFYQASGPLSLGSITGGYSGGAIGVDSSQTRSGFVFDFGANGTNTWNGPIDRPRPGGRASFAKNRCG